MVNNPIVCFFMVCIYHLVMIRIDLSETTQKKQSRNPRQRPRQNSVQEKSLSIFFQ